MSDKRKFDPEKISLAIVASSSPSMSINDKLQLYMDAYEACETSLSCTECEAES